VVADLSQELVRRGHGVEVVSLLPVDPVSPIARSLAEAGVPFRSLDLSHGSAWRMGRLDGALLRFDPDVVHAHLFHAHVASRLRRGNRRSLIVNTYHNVEPPPGFHWRHLADRATVRRAHRLTAVSESVAAYQRRRLGRSGKAITVVFNGIRPARTPSPGDRAALRASWGMEDVSLMLGAVGRLHPQKGFDRLLALLPGLAAALPRDRRWGLVVLGDGPERGRLERMARDLPPEIRVALPGFRADAAEAMAAFDVLLVPSRWEGFGLVVAEGMAHGVPVIAQSLDVLSELVRGYAAGRILDFAPGREIELAASVLALAGTGIPQFRFTAERMVEGYLEVYDGSPE